MSDAKQILDFAEKETQNFLNILKTAVEIESPTYESKEAADKCSRYYQGLYRELGFSIKAYPQTDCGENFVAEYGQGDEAIMLVGHYDTVFPLGSLSTMPWKVEDGKAYGPGVYDMKGGLVQAYFAVKALKTFNVPLSKKIIICVNGDEEPGSYSSRALMEETARRCKYALVLEPGTGARGGVKTARFGRAVYKIFAHGCAAHSGNEPWKAISSIQELAHQAQVLFAMTDRDNGISVSPTFLNAGMDDTATIPGTGQLTVDVRSPTIDGLDKVMTSIEALKPKLDGMRLEIKGGMNKPVFEFNAKNKALFDVANSLAQELGFGLTAHTVGGGSDGNFTSYAGTPTLDGLGMEGNFLHNPKEYILIDAIPLRVALLARLIQTL